MAFLLCGGPLFAMNESIAARHSKAYCNKQLGSAVRLNLDPKFSIFILKTEVKSFNNLNSFYFFLFIYKQGSGNLFPITSNEIFPSASENQSNGKQLELRKSRWYISIALGIIYVYTSLDHRSMSV
jgi:hypothetical protein